MLVVMERVLRRRGKLSVLVYGLLLCYCLCYAVGPRVKGMMGVLKSSVCGLLCHCQPLPAVDDIGSQTILVLVVVVLLTTVNL